MKTAMTDEEKNRAIAFACGWKWEFNGDHEDPEWFWIPPDDPDGEGEPPDFLNDLQAMDDAMTALQPGQMWKYGENLQKEIGLVWGDFQDFCRNIVLIAHASARQRAEAFLKTIQQP